MSEIQENFGIKLGKPKNPVRQKAQWDLLLEEMSFTANNFRTRGQYGRYRHKKICQIVKKYFKQSTIIEKNQIKQQEIQLKKIACDICKDMKKWWDKSLTLAQKIREKKHESMKEKEIGEKLHQTINVAKEKIEQHQEILAGNKMKVK